MDLPVCQNCSQKWTWKMTMRQFFRFKRSMICENCGATQYQSKESLWKMNLIGIGPYIFIPFLIGFNTSLPIVISYAAVAILLFLMISPYLLTLSNQEEPLF